MAPYWGFNGSVTDFCRKAKQAGYDGVEILWSAGIAAELFEALKENQLDVGFLCRGDGAEPGSHFESFKKVLKEAAGNPYQKPLYINVHSGRDFFSYEVNKRFIDYTIRYAKESGVAIYHETHRSRCCIRPLHQVSDPRAPEWKSAAEAHFAWWDKVVAIKKQESKMLTMLTEFGPPTYMPTIPFTNHL